MELVSREQAAKILGISANTLTGGISEKKYPLVPHTYIGRKVMYKLSDVNALSEERIKKQKGKVAHAKISKEKRMIKYYKSGDFSPLFFNSGRDYDYAEELPEEVIGELRIGRINDDY